MFNPDKMPGHFSEHLYAKQVRFVPYGSYISRRDTDPMTRLLPQSDNMTNPSKKALSNAQKQKRYRERQKESGKRELRGYLTQEALSCYQEIQQKTEWTDSVLLSNAIRLMYAAHKCGQIGILNSWLTEHKR